LEAISAGLDVPIQALPWFAGHGNEGITSRALRWRPLLGWSGWEARYRRSMYRSPTSPRSSHPEWTRRTLDVSHNLSMELVARVTAVAEAAPA